MYGVSAKYKEKVDATSRRIRWIGTLTTTAGVKYALDETNIVIDTGKLTRQLCDDSSLAIGKVNTAQLELQLYLDADRYTLFDAIINLSFLLNIGNLVGPLAWGDLEEFGWSSLEYTKWEDLTKENPVIWEPVTVGVFKVSEATRDMSTVSLTAYDYMLSFEKSYKPDAVARNPYDWLLLWCSACNVELGMSKSEVDILVNGTRRMAFADVVEDVKTYRDALSYLCEVTATNATIDRYGQLVLIPYKTKVLKTYKKSNRFSSKFSDYITYYSGMYATYKTGGLSEYYKNTSYTGSDDGLVLDLGTNPFLQITNASNRANACKSIINNIAKVHYAPYEVSMPQDLSLDLGDVIGFEDNQASDFDFGAITQISVDLGGAMTVKCSGENPRLYKADTRWTKNIEGLLDKSSNGSAGGNDMWILLDNNGSPIQFEQSTDNQKTQIAATFEFTLTESMLVTITIYLDGNAIETYTGILPQGQHTKTVVKGYIITDKETHTVSAVITGVKKDLSTVRVTLPYLGWSESAPYTQTVKVDGISATDELGMPEIEMIGDQATDESSLTNLSYLSYAETGNGEITFGCYRYKPSHTISIKMRRWL